MRLRDRGVLARSGTAVAGETREDLADLGPFAGSDDDLGQHAVVR
jgi:hypothetical protein